MILMILSTSARNVGYLSIRKIAIARVRLVIKMINLNSEFIIVIYVPFDNSVLLL